MKALSISPKDDPKDLLELFGITFERGKELTEKTVATMEAISAKAKEEGNGTFSTVAVIKAYLTIGETEEERCLMMLSAGAYTEGLRQAMILASAERAVPVEDRQSN